MGTCQGLLHASTILLHHLTIFLHHLVVLRHHLVVLLYLSSDEGPPLVHQDLHLARLLARSPPHQYLWPPPLMIDHVLCWPPAPPPEFHLIDSSSLEPSNQTQGPSGCANLFSSKKTCVELRWIAPVTSLDNDY
ncbi:unnamed protein product [Linum trigynum]|uniref:Uncharacterized protein n=1 Tax=Linum trigynum TaxID=586398 RepID=A0AAV2FN70_9ROSI